MKLPEWIRSFFSRNLLLKTLSLFLAILLWFYISQRGQESFTMNVPIIVNHLPPDVQLEDASPAHVLITLTAPPGLYQQVRDQDLSVRVRADLIPKGRRHIRIDSSMITLPPNVHLQRISPDIISLHLIRTVTRILPIELEYFGQLNVPLNRFRIMVFPTTARVRGDIAILDKMQSLRIPPINLRKINAGHSTQFVIPIDPQERHGIKVLGPQSVTVTIIPRSH